MTTDGIAKSVAAALALVSSTISFSSNAHDAGGEGPSGDYRLSAVGMVAHANISLGEEDLDSWTVGGGLNLYAGGRLGSSYRTGVTLNLSLLSPTNDLTLGGRSLEGVALFSGAALWMSYVGSASITGRFGLGPALVHAFESSGALNERTAFGVTALAGLGYEFTPAEALSFDLGIAATISQAFTGSDYRSTIDHVHTEGVIVTIGFGYEARP
jgi:hypothetical protein